MNEQQKNIIIARIEKMLLETDDIVSKILLTVIREELGHACNPFSTGKTLQKIFRKKHGMGMAVWREQHTGNPDHHYKSKLATSRLKPKMVLAKKLLSNTQFTQRTISEITGVSVGQLLGQLRQEGLTSKTFRKQYTQTPSQYHTQPIVRWRERVSGGLKTVQTEAGSVRYDYRLTIDEHAILSLDVLEVSFSLTAIVNGSIVTKPMELVGKLAISTGFQTPNKATVTSSETITFTSPFNDKELIKLRVCYDVVIGSLTFLCSQTIRDLSFTLVVTQTEL